MDLAETYEHKGVTVNIYFDPHAESPRGKEWRENFGTMVCWHRRYDLGDEQASRDFDSIQDLIASYEARIVLPLGLYDHSGITMYVGAGTHPSGCDTAGWDSGQVGFIFVTAEKIREEYGVKRITQSVLDKAEALLRSEVEEYDDYLTGECYGFVVDEDGPDEDSCWGFIGDMSYCKEQANESAECAAEARAERDLVARMYALDPTANPYAVAR